MKRGKEHGCSFVVMSACSPIVGQEENSTRLGRGLGVALAVVVILAVVGVNSAGAQTPKTPEAVTANILPVSENTDALESAAGPRGCGNGVCNGRETCSTCPADCGVCPPVCGDGTCNGTETCSTCSADCGVCPPVCGDGTCNGAETCSTCAADCGVCSPVCGDGTCNGTETCNTCSADCGVCPPVCGDGSCNGTETCSTCTSDCGQCRVCGDGVCNVGENCGTCVADCGTCTPCTQDSDCVPATCCDARACVPLGQAPNCNGVACDADCTAGTMDCGQGYCACQNGQCNAVIFWEFQNSTELSSDPARTSPELAAPANLSALGSQGQIDISWEDNSHGETGFEVHRSPTGAPNSFILLETVGINGTAFSNSGLTIDEHFCYQVRAVREGTSTTTYSDFSNIACTTAAPVARDFGAVFAGGAHTCALTSVGAAYCWGRGESGQLGVPPPSSTCLTDAGPFSCSMVPVPVGGGLTFVKLAGGGAHTCGLRSDGTAYCWGNNTYGQLGDNSTTSRNAPVPVLTGLKFDSIDAGAAHTCAVTKDAGAAYCWGRNDRGQLGDGTTTNSAVPVAVAGGLTFQLIAAGGFSIGHTCGLTDLGAAHCWGDNERGQLGTGTSDLDPHALPEPVSGGFVFDGLTAGLGRHSCALTDLGAAYCWGENTFGALGNRSRKDSAVPVAVVGNLSFDQLIAGGFIGHTCGVIERCGLLLGREREGPGR